MYHIYLIQQHLYRMIFIRYITVLMQSINAMTGPFQPVKNQRVCNILYQIWSWDSRTDQEEAFLNQYACRCSSELRLDACADEFWHPTLLLVPLQLWRTGEMNYDLLLYFLIDSHSELFITDWHLDISQGLLILTWEKRTWIERSYT